MNPHPGICYKNNEGYTDFNYVSLLFISIKFYVFKTLKIDPFYLFSWALLWMQTNKRNVEDKKILLTKKPKKKHCNAFIGQNLSCLKNNHWSSLSHTNTFWFFLFHTPSRIFHYFLHSHKHTHSLSVTNTLTLLHTLSLTHTHTLSLSLSYPLLMV